MQQELGTSRYDISSFNTLGDARAHARTLPVVTPLNKEALWEKPRHARLISHGRQTQSVNRRSASSFKTHASRHVCARAYTHFHLL